RAVQSGERDGELVAPQSGTRYPRSTAGYQHSKRNQRHRCEVPGARPRSALPKRAADPERPGCVPEEPATDGFIAWDRAGTGTCHQTGCALEMDCRWCAGAGGCSWWLDTKIKTWRFCGDAKKGGHSSAC